MNEMLFYDLKQSFGFSHSLASQIARELGRRIVAGFYQTGALLEEEGALAIRYRVSRSVIRDAVKILSGKGLLEVRRGIGTRVRARSCWVLFDDDILAWHQSAPLDHNFLRQLLDFRLVIEPRAARWSAERGSHESHVLIKQAQARMEQEQGSVEDFIIADASFHRAILRASGNEFMQAIEGAIYSALLSSIRLTNSDPRENEASMQVHHAVCEAIQLRDGALAESRMEQLLGDARERLESRFQSATNSQVGSNVQTALTHDHSDLAL